MKSIYLSFALVASFFYSLPCAGQSPYDSIDVNNINARINPTNDLFWDGVYQIPRYEVPIGSGKTTISNSEMWIGGVDQGGNLKLAAQTYRQSGTDFWTGPVDTTTASIDRATISKWNLVWKINRTSIDSFILWSNNHSIYPGYVIPQNIMTWPGNGDSAHHQAHQLAPFVDENNDGIYNPADGDYPCIKGDQALFYIFNDVGNIHTQTGGAPIGIEVHAMVYGFNNPFDTALYNTIFVNYQIFNRSKNSTPHCYIGNFTDTDIGGGANDYIGCAVDRSYFYGYSGDSINAGDNGYGLHPPAQGIVMLKGPLADPDDSLDNNHNGVTDEPGETFVMSNFVSINNDFSVTGNPLTAADYYNYLKETWTDQTHVTYGETGYGGSTPCNYMFPGSSDSTNWGTGLGHNNGPSEPAWSEITAGDVPGDRSGLGVWGPFTLLAGQIQCIDYAYVTALDTNRNNLTIVNTLQQRTDSVKSFYLNHPELQTCSCTASTVGVNNLEPASIGFTVFPNPANELLSLYSKSFHSSEAVTVSILNMLGQTMQEEMIKWSSNANIHINALAQGIYFLQLKTENGSAVKMFVKE